MNRHYCGHCGKDVQHKSHYGIKCPDCKHKMIVNPTEEQVIHAKEYVKKFAITDKKPAEDAISDL